MINRILHGRLLEIQILSSHVENLPHSFATLTRKRSFQHSKIESVSPHPSNILSTYFFFQYDFWTFPGSIGKSVDIHIKSRDYGNFTKFLYGHGIKYETLMFDVQRVIDHQNDFPVNANEAPTDWYRKYHRFEEVYSNCIMGD